MCYQLTELQADELITSIKELQEDKKRFEKIAAGKIESIQNDLKYKSKVLDEQMQFSKDQLRAFFNTIKSKETKTQKSYSLLSGKLIYKKPSQKIAHDDTKLEGYLFQHAGNFLKETTTTKIDWAGFKKGLTITNGSIMNKATGQVLDNMEGLSLEEVAESFEVK